MIKVRYLGKSDVGKVRELNEDAYYINQLQNIVAVCDGMGGHKGGEIASNLTVKTIQAIFSKTLPPEWFKKATSDIETDLPEKVYKLILCARLGNRLIFEIAVKNPDFAGMGTTLVAGLFLEKNLYVINVGDSRCYLFRDDALIRITSDHSWLNELIKDREISLEEAKNFPQKNIITRALGIADRIKIDLYKIGYKKNDIFLFCSDGITDVIDDEQLEQILKRGFELDEINNRLINLANLKGGPDNITSVLCGVEHVDYNLSQPKIETISIPEEKTSEIVVAEKKLISKLFDKKENKIEIVKNRKKNYLKFFAFFLLILISSLVVLYNIKKDAFVALFPSKFDNAKKFEVTIISKPSSYIQASIVLSDTLRNLFSNTLFQTPDTLYLEKGRYRFVLSREGYQTIKLDTLIDKNIAFYCPLKPKYLLELHFGNYLDKISNSYLYINDSAFGKIDSVDNKIAIDSGTYKIILKDKFGQIIGRKDSLKIWKKVTVIMLDDILLDEYKN